MHLGLLGNEKRPVGLWSREAAPDRSPWAEQPKRARSKGRGKTNSVILMADPSGLLRKKYNDLSERNH